MKLPHRDDLDTGAVAGRLDELSQAVRAGRLVPLLKGKGLDMSTVEELLQPESVSALKAILTDHLFPSPGEPPERIGATRECTNGETGPSTVAATAATPAGKERRTGGGN